MPGDRQSLSERVRLGERRRQAMLFSALRGLTIDQIARILETSRRTVCRDQNVGSGREAGQARGQLRLRIPNCEGG